MRLARTWQISKLFKVHLRAGEARDLELVKNAKEEVLFIFPTSNAYIRQEKMGAIPLAVEHKRTRKQRLEFSFPTMKKLKTDLFIILI